MTRPGLRARKVARTRDQIADAARRLFAEKGYDATTLEEVAEAADVHKRTLLRYFPSKAHLLLHPQYAALEGFRAQVAERGDTPIIDVWQAHVTLYSRRRQETGRSSNLAVIAANEPAVGPTTLAIQAQYQDIVADGLCRDMGRDPATDVFTKVAAAALVAGNYAIGAMINASEAYDDLETAELEVIRIVREGLLDRLGR
ncbi:MAG: TetR family transcriptional regulator [Proteobacteria bacterium]|nr:TetR family transcriptional regulator [Pseudomonadota bacterium]